MRRSPKGEQSALATQTQTQQKCGSALAVRGVNVEETALEKRKSKQRADGSKEFTVTEQKRRRLSCKTSGKEVESQSITKRRQVKETENEVIETSTITITRVRRKS